MRRAALLLAALCQGGALPGGTYALKPAWPSLPPFRQPVALVAGGDGSGRLFVVEREGRIHSFLSAAPDEVKLFLDITGKARLSNDEEGLLCLAFHPLFKVNHRFYIIYSLANVVPRRTRLSEWRTKDLVPDSADEASEKVLLEVEKKHGNHNGATITFGSDGFLYVSLGDGGGGGDQDGNAQNPRSLLGKVLRLDVDHAAAGKAYGIPRDNPWAGRSGAAPEVWAWGLRNPWRMSFDPTTGELWAGDVGQNAWEEVDVIKKGGNYGWNFREGSHPFIKGKAAKGLVEPVFDYGRDKGFCITGGVVYRGASAPGLAGRYLFADFGSKAVWSLDAKSKARSSLQVACKAPEAPASFGTDEAGEAYVVGYEGGIFRFLQNN